MDEKTRDAENLWRRFWKDEPVSDAGLEFDVVLAAFEMYGVLLGEKRGLDLPGHMQLAQRRLMDACAALQSHYRDAQETPK